MIKKLVSGNDEFVDKIHSDIKLNGLIKELSVNGQHPYALVITCSDSRVIPELIFNKTFGELFVIRTAGNVINDGERATIEYAIEHLKVENIIVLGHTHCGAVHAAIHNEKGKYMDPILSKIKSAIKDEVDEVKATNLNADSVVKYIKSKFPKYKGGIIKAIYNIETGIVIM